MTDLNKLKKFLNDAYRDEYLSAFVKGGIAYQIQALREQAGLNQIDFGKLVGMPQASVSRIEDTEYGGVNINTLLKIAKPLGIGLIVKFCNFETILDSDFSPQGLRVENITSTVKRLSAPTATPTPAAVVKPTIVEGHRTWQQMILVNQSPIWSLHHGSGTPSFGRSMPMPHSTVLAPMTLQ